MIAPGAFEQLVGSRQAELLKEAAVERMARSTRPVVPSLRKRLAVSLYWLATQLTSGMAEARVTRGGIRAIATSHGVEYWRPATSPLRH
jgi:hypothetical protein